LRIFSTASSKFRGKRRVPQHDVKIRVLQNTTGAAAAADDDDDDDTVTTLTLM